MKYPIVVLPDAESDMEGAHDWYNSCRDGLGQEFVTAVKEVLDFVSGQPEIYAKGYKSVRQAGVGRFPYFVYYRFVRKTVEVIAVHHGSRHPRNWKSRA